MRKLLISFGLLLASCLVQAHDFTVGALHLQHPYARPTPPGAQVGAAYVAITNKGKSTARLLSARAEVAQVVELHDMAMIKGVMEMRQVPTIEIQPGATLSMQPGGGYHLMLLGLTEPLRLGAKFPVWLTFADEGEVKVEVWVEAAGAAAAVHHHHEHQHHHENHHH